MDTSLFQSHRPPLAITNANVPLGLSPSKPIKNTPQTLSIPTSLPTEYPSRSDVIGLRAVDSASSSGHAFTIVSHRSIAILLGRARNSNEEQESQVIETDSRGLGSTPIRRISLPSSAKHVSRDHAIIFHSPFGSSWAVKILGQNGLIVNGNRKRAGLTLKLVPGQSTLDFFGVNCLFLGGGKAEEEDLQRENDLRQRNTLKLGQSPEKRVESTSSTSLLGTESSLSAASQLDSQLKRIVASPIKRKVIGNPLKRPFGAPPSPPTSSPAPFDLSSPGKQKSSRPSYLLASSSPAHHESEENEDSSDEEFEDPDRSSSPSLSRRCATLDDSGVVFEVDEQDSEDEASQAIRVESLKHKAIQSQQDEEDQSESEEETGTPSPSPMRKKLEKKVTFTRRDSPKTESRERATSHHVPLPSFQKVQSHLRAKVSQLAETYDLQGLLAGAIVFHRTATISATEAVRSVLTSNPGLLRGEVGPEGPVRSGTERGMTLTGWAFDEIHQSDLISDDTIDKEKVEVWQRKAWREKLEECLMEGECFGIISRAGKDASGNPLECWYYYDKDGDPDAERAANLGALAKPMRAALKTHKPIFWKKAAYGHLNENNQGSRSDGYLMASESQWGSSGNALDSMLFSSRNSASKGEGEEKLPLVQSSCWDETQQEEREKTWDREGDTDFEMRAKKVRRRK